MINLLNIKKRDQPLQSLLNITLLMPLEYRDNISGLSFTETISTLETCSLFSEMLNMKNNLFDFRYGKVLITSKLAKRLLSLCTEK